MKTKIILSFICLFFLFSCQQDLNNFQDIDKIQSTGTKINNYELTEAQAKEILLLYLNRDKSNTKSSTAPNVNVVSSTKNYISLNRSIKTKSGSTLETDIPIYNFSISNDSFELGFALVSGDLRYPSILAHAELGNLNDTIFNKGLAEWYNYTLPDALQERIAEYTEIDIDSINSNNRNLKLGDRYPALIEGWEYWDDTRKFSHETSTHTYYYKGGAIEYIRATGFNERLENYTEWDQVAPYNNMCSYCYSSSDGIS